MNFFVPKCDYDSMHCGWKSRSGHCEKPSRYECPMESEDEDFDEYDDIDAWEEKKVIYGDPRGASYL